MSYQIKANYELVIFASTEYGRPDYRGPSIKVYTGVCRKYGFEGNGI